MLCSLTCVLQLLQLLMSWTNLARPGHILHGQHPGSCEGQDMHCAGPLLVTMCSAAACFALSACLMDLAAAS